MSTIHIRSVLLRPYVASHPHFQLDTYYGGCRDGRDWQGYRFSMIEPSGERKVLWDCSDCTGDELHGLSPMHEIGSDEALADLLGFLTEVPGQSGGDRVEHYTPEQTAYALAHGEVLSMFVNDVEEHGKATWEPCTEQGEPLPKARRGRKGGRGRKSA